MENQRLVMPEHLNHYGYLFGGKLLQWVDECAWIAASRDYPGRNFVTVAMDQVEFKVRVKQGAVLRFEIRRAVQGKTSVTYAANVYNENIDTGGEDHVFSTQVTFVSLGADGRKKPIGSVD